MADKYSFLITGASKGIGYAVATYLSKKGHHVIGIARHAPPPENPFPGNFYIADLADEHATENLFKLINAEHQVDGIINNVSTAFPAKIEDIKNKDLDLTFNLNLKPAIQALQIFGEGMIKRKFGRIVNVSSRAALGVPRFSVYAAAKAALISFSRSWALELIHTGITVNTVAPGPTGTESFYHFIGKDKELEKKIIEKIPMGRVGQPKEVAAAIAFFLSEDAGFITGQTLFIDGGENIGRAPI